jgi:AraC-like DNA-binding protein
MHPPGSDVGLRRFSTEGLAERDRAPFWSDFFANVIVNCDAEVEPGRPFYAEAELLVWPELQVLWSKEAPMRYTRSRARAADGDDSLVLLIRRSGVSTLSQRGNELSARAGEGIGFLAAEPTTAMTSDIDALNVVVPRAALAPLVGDVASRTMRLVPSDCEALRLLTSYVEILRQGPGPGTPELRHLAATHVHDLIAAALGATRDGAAIAEGRGLRAARLRAVKADILGHLGSSDLTVAAVALRQRISPRYVHMLFEAEGLTFSEFVLGQRLLRAFRMLTDPRLRPMTIGAIAFAAGFGDLSYFNRTFRRRFGARPSEVRSGTAQ